MQKGARTHKKFPLCVAKWGEEEEKEKNTKKRKQKWKDANNLEKTNNKKRKKRWRMLKTDFSL